MLIKIPRRRIDFTPSDIVDFVRSLLLNRLKEGREIGRFEKMFAKYIGVKYAMSTYSGKQALYLILKSLNFKKGDEILIPSYTASSVPISVFYAGLKPTFVDVDSKTFNINSKLIEKRINKKTKAIIVTHIHGLPCDMDALSKLCAKHGLYIIEDCAHALGAEYKGKKVGCFGKASFFSLGFGKHLSSFGGGVIVSNDHKLIKNARKFMREFESPSNLELLHKLLKAISLSIFTNPLIFCYEVVFLITTS